MKAMVAGFAGLLMLPALGQPEVQAVCPLAALGPARPEGVRQYVPVGQPRPCPPPNRVWSDFSVTTDFGDGEVAETPFREGDHLWFAGGTHTYRRAGTYDLFSTVTDRHSGEQQVIRRTIEVPNARLRPRRCRRPRFISGTRQPRTVACFRDENRLAAASDYTALIRWGDGSRSAGSIARRGGYFIVRGVHRYSTSGILRIRAVVRDDRRGKVELATTAVVRRR
jgi:hypothetical protein